MADKFREEYKGLEAKSIAILRECKLGLDSGIKASASILSSISKLESLVFSAEMVNLQALKDSYLELKMAMMNQKSQNADQEKKHIGLQIGTSNDIAPIRLEWDYYVPGCKFVIEFAKFDEKNHPNWEVFSETSSQSFTVRGLPTGKSYWFRISAVLPQMAM